jgi:hypothetical protein
MVDVLLYAVNMEALFSPKRWYSCKKLRGCTFLKTTVVKEVMYREIGDLRIAIVKHVLCGYALLAI